MKQVKYISPNCCTKAKTTQVVRLGLYPDDIEFGQWKDIKPKWYLVGEEMLHNRRYNTKIEIFKCPFCGAFLPELELNDEYKNITEGDEEYCRTCGERHMCCNCYPPEYRWKPITE